MSRAKVGFIGGSGFYEIEGANVIEEVKISTPWGEPSDSIVIAEIEDRRAAFLPRHGRGHLLLPAEVNSRANIAAMKMIGVEEIFAFSAVGSLKENIRPREFVLPNQVIDRTRQRQSTFFGNGVVAHVGFADPFCPRLHDIIIPAANETGIAIHKGETVICMEGPAFSTRAESRLYRSWGAGIINMSSLPEAKLAREAEICYAIICMSTDYDCWREEEEAVTVEMIIGNLTANSSNAKKLMRSIIARTGGKRDCGCHGCVKNAIITAPASRGREQCERLKTILPEYFS
jgi:5'-methylthioadenosine phosphorylase